MYKIKIPNRFIVNLSKLSTEQKRQYLMIRSWSKKRAKRYAYLVTHPEYRGRKIIDCKFLNLLINTGQALQPEGIDKKS